MAVVRRRWDEPVPDGLVLWRLEIALTSHRWLMRLDFSDERVLAVVAHPDDAELLCAGTLARARDAGAVIAVCVACRGDKGQPQVLVDDLAIVRRAEMQQAAALLGAELFTLDQPDSELFDTVEVRRLLVEVARQFRPTLLLGHHPEDYHVDHRALSHLTEVVSWLATSPGFVTTSPPLETSPALWWLDLLQQQGPQPELYVDISGQLELKQRLLECHASQLQRGNDGNFAPLAELMRQQATLRGQQSGVIAAEGFTPYRAFKRTRAW
ncbi:MAG: PIG-L family deacetylase [Planctomycetaceae bacterium]|nr:PIG-L family deacetylase [Planctomycetaceae bacterium]